MKLFVGNGWLDIKKAFIKLQLPLFLAWADIRQRYRRSSLGPFWITISTGIMITTIGIIFGNLFKSPMAEFLPFLASGLIIWGFLASCISDSTVTFTVAEAVIKQLPLPLTTHIIRMIARNFYIFLHNLIIIPLVIFFVGRPIGLNVLWIIPGLALLISNLIWLSVIISVVCTRFRDLTQIVASLLQIFFYVTPIIWMPSLLPARTSVMILEPNPFYHLLEIVRAPLMNQVPTISNWVICLLMSMAGWLVAIVFFNKYRSRVAYWL